MERPKTRHVHDFGISRRDHEPQNQHDLSFEATGYSDKSKKIPNQFQKYYSWKSHNFGNQLLMFLEKTGAENHGDPF